jgi:hypothetical protein
MGHAAHLEHVLRGFLLAAAGQLRCQLALDRDQGQVPAEHVVQVDQDGLVGLLTAGRTFEPVVVGTGVATAEEYGMETFEQWLRDEWEKTQVVIGTALMLSVWATAGPE